MHEPFQIIHGDCLDVLPTLGAQSIDLVLTDPPYMIGAVSVGNTASKAGTWADMENSAYWFAAWMQAATRTLRPTGFLATFGNWRSIPTLIRALSLCKMPATSCVVWDKQWIGPASPAQFRPRYEVVVVSAMPEAVIRDRSAPDVIPCKWMAGNMKTTVHPAEKPADLLAELIRQMLPDGGVVVDPFAGSGSTGVGAAREGCTFIGIEREAEYVDIARARVAAAYAQTALALA
jgi:site-specific DNA-methyltransferase (adenine-specific)